MREWGTWGVSVSSSLSSGSFMDSIVGLTKSGLGSSPVFSRGSGVEFNRRIGPKGRRGLEGETGN